MIEIEKIYDLLLVFPLALVLTVLLTTPFLNRTKAGDAVLIKAFGKRTLGTRVEFDAVKTSLFIFVAYLGIYGSLKLTAYSDPLGLASLGAVTGLFVAVIGTMKRQEKRSTREGKPSASS